MSLAVNICVEAPDEFQVQEITYDGQEKYIQPMSMSENLGKLAQRIDFNEAEGEPAAEKPAEEKSESKELTSFQPSLWPWDNVRNKLRSAYTEISVLLDVLNVTREKRYMVLDPVQQEPPEVRPPQVLVAKKKALASTALIILNGSERLRAAQSDATRNRSADFHTELMKMRQNWRIRKTANAIFGDLSYRSAGSRYPHPGTFEIHKNELTTAPTTPSTPGSTVPTPIPCALKVTVPPDLEGVSYIHVSIQKGSETLASTDFSIPVTESLLSNWEQRWDQKLDNAHNVLFCKELFVHLAREAVQVQMPIPTLVMNNQIMATLFPKVQLTIGLCNSSIPNKRTAKSKEPLAQNRKDHHKPVLEHSLHQLLREVHYNALHQPMPHPTTAILGLTRKRYLAGPQAHDKQSLIDSCQSETMLEKIIAQAQHSVLRHRTLHMIDSLAHEIQDPLIIAHWMCLNSPTKSSVKINIVTYNYEQLSRAPMVVHVGTNTVKAIMRDGRVVNMSYESQDLKHLILTQISQHQVAAVQSLAKLLGWNVICSATSCGNGPVEKIGTASSVVLASPNGERMISLWHGPDSGAKVYVSTPGQDFYPGPLVRDHKWQNMDHKFKEVDLNRLEGRSLVSKMEYLMAALTQC